MVVLQATMEYWLSITPGLKNQICIFNGNMNKKKSLYSSSYFVRKFGVDCCRLGVAGITDMNAETHNTPHLTQELFVLYCLIVIWVFLPHCLAFEIFGFPSGKFAWKSAWLTAKCGCPGQADNP
jgi:hypothetical protein